MLDLLISGGTVVDGTGRPGRRVDLGIRDGRVVAFGDEARAEGGRRHVDAGGQVVAPGLIDVHTHYDAQVMWDPWVTPSSLNGVTTVIGGNCGFTIAPMAEADASYLLSTLARVEGMSLDSLEAGLDLGWGSFGDWLDRLEGHLGVNAGFSVGHSTVRRIVMGEHAHDAEPSAAHLAAMAAEVRAGLEAGALGFSSSWGSSHFDHNGTPVPSRRASADEVVALASIVGEYPGTTLEFLPTTRPSFGPEQYEVMTRMAVSAGRRLNWNLMVVRPGDQERAFRDRQLRATDEAAVAGATVTCLTLPQPMRMRLSLLSGVLYDTVTGWFDVLHLPLDERLRALRQPSVRAAMAAGALADGYHDWTDWDRCRLGDAVDPSLDRFVGRTFADIGAELGVPAFDAMLDLLIADELRAGVAVPESGGDEESWRDRVALLREGRVMAGGSDAGAHLDMMQTWSCYVEFLAEAVRRRELLSLEEAVRLFTDVPARFYGLTGRGRIEQGAWADLIVFDPATIGPGPTEVRHDLPAGGWRLYSEATGIGQTVVNGVEITRDGRLTGDQPGTLIRSGRDTA